MSDSRAYAAGVWLAIAASMVTGTAHLGLKWTADLLRQAGGFTPGVAFWLGLFYAVQGAALLLYLLALRRGDLSTMYPLLSLRYLWVVALGALLFPADTMNTWKVAGVVLVAVGVMAVARGGAEE